MLLAFLGVGLFALGIWLLFALRPTEAGDHPALKWPMAETFVPLGIVMLITMGPMLIIKAFAD